MYVREVKIYLNSVCECEWNRILNDLSYIR